MKRAGLGPCPDDGTRTRGQNGLGPSCPHYYVIKHAHPGSPYVFGLAGANHDIEFPDPMPVIGISHSAKGYCMISVLETVKTFSIEDGLTEEAVVTKLRTSQFHHLFLHTTLRQNSSGTCRWGEFGEGGLLWGECNHKQFEWFNGIPVDELLCKVRDIYGLDEETSFRNITVSSEKRPKPLYLATATQIGVIPTEGIPSLLSVLLPPSCKGLPILIKHVVDEVIQMYKNVQLVPILQLLMHPTWAATGLQMEMEILVDECELISKRIDEMISVEGETDQFISSSEFMPREFFEDIESSWRGRVKRVHAEEAFAEVERAADALTNAVVEDFVPIVSRIKSILSPLGGPRGEISYSREHEAIWFKGKRFTPTVWAGTPGEEQIKQLKHATDSKGRKVGDEWFTTCKVDDALSR
ncbi:hypothetical protein Taro_015538 [Colocasia esculenta]|uniref:Uncharacterized protein n=1 Tax=Colocasia esculenta TaxID=4460 RepID=A0A843UQ53_COLES|nr:hypothetical protein [Colocasia esculenta]